MQFTIRVVIVITALVALTFRATRTFQQIRKSETDIATLNETIEKNRPATQMARNELRVLHAGIDAADNYAKVTERAKQKFVAIQAKYGELKLTRPDRIKVVRYPMVSTDGVIRNRWQVYIPESDNVCLRSSVVEYRKKVELTESDFDPTVPIDIPMPSGISSVTFQWQRIDGRPTGTVLINDDAVYSTVYEGKYNRASDRVRIPSDTSSNRKTRLDLLELSPAAPQRFTLRLQLNRNEGDQ